MGTGIDDHVNTAAVLSLTCTCELGHNVHLTQGDSQEVPA
jgi:hypothetical protein